MTNNENPPHLRPNYKNHQNLVNYENPSMTMLVLFLVILYMTLATSPFANNEISEMMGLRVPPFDDDEKGM